VNFVGVLKVWLKKRNIHGKEPFKIYIVFLIYLKNFALGILEVKHDHPYMEM
jgi:hypothetical protein